MYSQEKILLIPGYWSSVDGDAEGALMCCKTPSLVVKTGSEDSWFSTLSPGEVREYALQLGGSCRDEERSGMRATRHQQGLRRGLLEVVSSKVEKVRRL